MKNIIFIFVLLSASAVGLFIRMNPSQANSIPHIIINEIQTAGASSNDEFIELFNPTSQDIDVSSWSIQYRGGIANTFYKKNFGSSDSIPAHGYFLIAHGSSYAGAMTYDMSWSQPLSESGGTIFLVSNQIVLINETAISSAVIDRVAYGTGSGLIPETTSLTPSPETGQSMERTNFADTDDNAADFSINTSPSSQNKSITEDDGEESSGDGESPDDTENNNGTALDTSDFCAAISSDIRLNEIFPYPESVNEFVEITNTSGSCVDVSGWKIMDEAGHKKEFPENSVLYPGEYLSLEGNLYLNNDSDMIYLLSTNGTAKSDALDRRFYEKAQKGFSYSFDGKSWQWTSSPTPKKENIITIADFKEDADDASSGKNYSSDEKVYLNEILPNPKDGSGEEYIEIANSGNDPVDLYGWRLKDGSKSKGYQFKEHIVLNSGEYFAIYRSDSKIALNNSNESVYLYNPEEKIVSSASYEKSQKNASYNFGGNEWRWSKYLTPGEKNKFDSEPTVKINKPKSVFKDLLTEFSAKAKDKETKKLKYTWDFGDGKKSYLAKTSHKYLDIGKYTVTLSVSDDSQTVEKSFVLAVKNYPRPDLEIVKIVPNPVGNDSDGEIVEIRNNSGKKIELRGWKIATGSDGKMNNHLISGEISLGSNETKTITREMCKFSINNKAGKIQLVMPDGKVTDVVEYQKEKIADDEAYVKINDEWRWITPNAPAETGDSEEMDDSEDTQDEKSEEQPDGEILGATDENAPYHVPLETSYTSEDEFIFLKFFGLLDYKPTESNFCPLNSPAADFIAFNS